MDWRGADLVLRRKAAVQVQTTWNRNQERYDKRGEAIRAAEALGLPYQVTSYSVIVGLPPKRPPRIPVVTEALPRPVDSQKRRKVLYTQSPDMRLRGQVNRVRRTSKQDIEW